MEVGIPQNHLDLAKLAWICFNFILGHLKDVYHGYVRVITVYGLPPQEELSIF